MFRSRLLPLLIVISFAITSSTFASITKTPMSSVIKIEITRDPATGVITDEIITSEKGYKTEIDFAQLNTIFGEITKMFTSLVDKLDLGKQLKGIFGGIQDLSNLFSYNVIDPNNDGKQLIEWTPNNPQQAYFPVADLPFGEFNWEFDIDPVDFIPDDILADPPVAFVKHVIIGPGGTQEVAFFPVVPEPGSVVLLSLGLIALVNWRSPRRLSLRSLK